MKELVNGHRLHLDESDEPYHCCRCQREYCQECNPMVQVDFDIKEQKDDQNRLSILYRKDSETINWKDFFVCPFCYKQLWEKHGEEEEGGGKK